MDYLSMIKTFFFFIKTNKLYRAFLLLIKVTLEMTENESVSLIQYFIFFMHLIIRKKSKRKKLSVTYIENTQRSISLELKREIKKNSYTVNNRVGQVLLGTGSETSRDEPVFSVNGSFINLAANA